MSSCFDSAGSYSCGTVGAATVHVFDAATMWTVALAALRENPFALVDQVLFLPLFFIALTPLYFFFLECEFYLMPRLYHYVPR